VLQYLQKLIAVFRQLGLADAADFAHFSQAAGTAVEDFQQGAVVKDDVWRDFFLTRHIIKLVD